MVEKEIENEDKDKEIVYIDFFGKESYRQILEEIVLKVNGTHNDTIDKIDKVSSSIFKTLGANINLDSIFSILKKEDFEDIIVCFDNIERKSDKLPLEEILGLVNLLKEDKSCSVVMILNKDQLIKRQNIQDDSNQSSNLEQEFINEENNFNWYETHKEKVVDYEIIIEDNSEIAKAIIEEKLKCTAQVEQKDIERIILDYFKQELDGNLRLLIKIIQHINYFNEKCFMRFYSAKEKEIFMETLNLHYKALFEEVMRFYLIKSEYKTV